jgi:hypothetical protein
MADISATSTGVTSNRCKLPKITLKTESTVWSMIVFLFEIYGIDCKMKNLIKFRIPPIFISTNILNKQDQQSTDGGGKI